jgi:hypothetical protein
MQFGCESVSLVRRQVHHPADDLQAHDGLVVPVFADENVGRGPGHFGFFLGAGFAGLAAQRILS